MERVRPAMVTLILIAYQTSAIGGATDDKVANHVINRLGETTCSLQRAGAGKYAGNGAVNPSHERARLSPPRVLKTNDGVAFSVLGRLPAKPAPTLIVLAGAGRQTLADDYFLQCGVHLKDRGYLCVSVDLPCHGEDVRPGEDEGLAGWKGRLNAGEPLVESFNARLTRVLNHLIALKYTDETRIAICGTSRGAFLAFHAAAHDSRIRCILGMAPVTTLLALDEFKKGARSEVAAQLSLEHIASKLVDRGVWIIIGDQDQRVGTDEAVRFARVLTKTALAQRIVPQVDLLVLSEPSGHTTPPGAAAISAQWLERKLDTDRD